MDIMKDIDQILEEDSWLMDEEQKSSFLNSSLAYIVKNPDSLPKFPDISQLLDVEDFIIYFYAKMFFSESASFTKELLKLSLEENCRSWFSKKSILTDNGKERITKEYIQSRIEGMLLSESEAYEAFVQVILSRFDEISQEEVSYDFSNQFYLDKLRKLIEVQAGYTLLENLTKITSNKGLYYDNNFYDKRNIISFINAVMPRINEKLSLNSSLGSQQEEIENDFIKKVATHPILFEWNLGKINTTLPVVSKGYVVSIIGQEKIGKSKFVTGEIVYPCTLLGRNVLYLSSEMDKPKMYSFLISKRIYDKNEFTIDQSTIQDCIAVMSIIRKYNINIQDYVKDKEEYIKHYRQKGKKEVFVPKLGMEMFNRLNEINHSIKTYLSTSDVKKEVIASHFSDIVNSEKYGKVIIKNMQDGVFNVDKMRENLKPIIAEENISLVVYDHAGHAHSDDKTASEAIVMKETYKIAKELAEDRNHPTTFVMVNHIATTVAEKIGSDKFNGGDSSIRGYGTSEAKKIADIEIALYTTEELKQQGSIIANVLVARDESSVDKKLILDVNYVVNDFTISGSTKNKYPEEL